VSASKRYHIERNHMGYSSAGAATSDFDLQCNLA
jgi:hypothetical protein